MGKCCCSVSSGLAGLVFFILAALIAIVFDPLVNSFIDKEIEIKNDSSSEMYKNWVEPPIVPYLKIYYFNLTNKDDFMLRKQKPIFQEVGPYVYREKWEKVNVSFYANNTVSYQTKKVYYFDSSLSSGSEDDVIHTLNVPANVAIDRIAGLSIMFQLLISSFLITLNQTAIVQKTVNELTWGYEDPLIDISKKYLPKSQQLPFDKFGFFYEKNGSTDGLLTVFTGVGDVSKLSTIDNFEHKHYLNFWNTRECNMVNGTDGTAYPPHVKKTSSLYMFNKNLCRSIPLIYNNTVQHNNIDNFRFVPPADIFAPVSEKPENLCYCVGGPPCIGGGVFNISSCTFNVSTLLSWPHFYQADSKYLDALVGLNPDPLKHSLYIDVNPRLGIPMSAQARFQVNFFSKNSSTIKIFSNMTPMVFPVLWFEDGVERLPPDVLKIINFALFKPKEIKMSMLIAMLVLGFCCVCLFIIFFYLTQKETKILTFNGAQPEKVDPKTPVEGHVNPVVSPESPD